MRAFDKEIQAFSGVIAFHLNYVHSSQKNKDNARKRMIKEYNRISKFPLSEISQPIWDEMNELAEKAFIITY